MSSGVSGRFNMKILFITNSFPFPPNSGGQMRSFNMLKHLATKGELTLISPADHSADDPYIPTLSKYCSQIVLINSKTFGPHSKSGRKVTLKERFEGILKMVPWSLQDFLSEEFHRKLLTMEPERFDLIFIRYPQLAYYFLTDKKLRKLLRKIVVDVDDVGVIMQERRTRKLPLGYSKLRNTVDLFFLKNYFRKMRNALACLITSAKDRDYLLNKGYAKQVFIVPNTIKINGYQESNGHDKNSEILFCGMLSYPHNEEAALFFAERVFPKIKKAFPGVRFTVVGKNPTEKVLKLNSLPGISVVGSVPSVKPYYERAAITVVPLLNGAGTRIKILESMSYQKPVVSTSVGAEGLDVRDGENICIADDPDSFAKKCVELLMEPKKRNEIARRAYQLVKEKYDHTVFKRKMNDLLDSLEMSHAKS